MIHTLVSPRPARSNPRLGVNPPRFESVSPLRALGCKNVGEFDRVLYGACRALFGWSFDEFKERWQENPGVNFTTRDRICPKVVDLHNKWVKDRDVTSLYNDPEYFMNSLAAGITGTTPNNLRQGMRYLAELFNDPPRRILDFGPGCGLTTISLAATFPNSEVTWADIPGTNSHKVAMALANYAGVADRISWEPRGDYDVVFALEVVEHLWSGEPRVGDPFADPLPDVLGRASDVLIYASQWRAENHGYLCPGHFLMYRIDGILCQAFSTDPRLSAKLNFEEGLRRRNFKLTWKGFNGQPLLFRRER